MEYSYSDILNLFFIHGECHKVIGRTCRTFNERYPHLALMTEKKFNRIVTNFKNHGQIKKPRLMPKSVTKDEVTEVNVLGYFVANPSTSIRSAERDIGCSRNSVQRILKNNKMHDFKLIPVQALNVQDPGNRIEFCEMMVVKMQEDQDFLKKIIWSDESKFSHDGIVNRHNVHVWATANPYKTRERNFQNKFSFNVMALLMDDRCFYYIYDENLTGLMYLNILRNQVQEFLDNLPLPQLMTCWFQLDGAPAHCGDDVSQELRNMFEDRWFRRLGPWPWPARSPDLTPLDFYLWGKIKGEVYETPVQTKEELRVRVINSFNNLDPQEIRKATIEGVRSRIYKCLEVNGSNFEHLIV